MSDHLPHPWHRKDVRAYDYEGQPCNEHWVLASDNSEVACLDRPEDADLIAAAPDLLQALENVVAVFHDHPDRNMVALAAARFVIAKAKGK